MSRTWAAAAFADGSEITGHAIVSFQIQLISAKKYHIKNPGNQVK